jgi:segregation and condensation protein A
MQDDTAVDSIADQALNQDALAYVAGEAVNELPQDLYIPPGAMEVFLEAFSGPLDLLLYLIKRQNIDILDIPIAKITKQYIEYVELMKDLKLDLAADYLLMAAMLAEIKSRMLLPRSPYDDENEDDPRADLVRRLQAYEQFKLASEDLDALPRRERDTFLATAKPPKMQITKPLPDVDLKELLYALQDVLKRVELRASHLIHKEPLSTRARMSRILGALQASDDFIPFQAFFDLEEGRMGVVVTFSAILELLKSAAIEIIQAESFGPIHIRAVSI